MLKTHAPLEAKIAKSKFREISTTMARWHQRDSNKEMWPHLSQDYGTYKGRAMTRSRLLEVAEERTDYKRL